MKKFTFFKSLKLFWKNLKIGRPSQKKLTLKIIISLIVLIICALIVYGMGIYKYHWSRYGSKTVVKIVPYPAGFVGLSYIPLADFEFQKGLVLHFYKTTGMALEDEAALNHQIMDRLIEQILIDRALRKQNITISKQDVENEYKTIIESNQGEENTKNMLEMLYGVSLGQFKSLIKDKLKIEKFRNDILASAKVSLIVIKDENRANDVLKQLKEGGDFAELAKKYSEDELSRDKGGDIGFVSRGGIIFDKPMTPEIENAIFSLEENTLPEAPLKTEVGFVIFKVTEKKGTINKSYSQWLEEQKSQTKIIKFIEK